MKITYIYHSCFVVEMEEAVFIFDYYKGELPTFEQDKQIYFFASHKHQDHFSLEIFQYEKKYENVVYVVSNDIKVSPNYLIRHGIDPTVKDKMIRIGKNQKITLNQGTEAVEIETFRSTDEGVAFLLTYKERTIYHAGDLNWWSWEGESEEEYKQMTEGYTSEINQLANRKIDVAFVVLDPRQGERFWWGFDYYMRKTTTEKVFPMHCWEDYTIITKLLEHEVSSPYRNKVMAIETENQIFDL